MAEPILVVESLADWRAGVSPIRLVAVDEYLTDPGYAKRAFHVINLCRGYRYQSTGYYCSLLAEARGHRVIPAVSTLQDLSRKSLYGFEIPALSAALERLPPDHRVGLPGRPRLLFGRSTHPGCEELARRAFGRFPTPLLELEIKDGNRPAVTSIKPLALRALNGDEQGLLADALDAHLAHRWRKPRRRAYRFDIAILADPGEAHPPSDKGALRRFVAAGRELGLDVEMIRASDFGRLAEFDALFIRETTRLGHHTYRFARRAEQEGLVVIDDPTSILRCTNKVYLAELLAAHRIPAPATCIFGEREIARLPELLGFPMVLKAPEGAFSKGVFKADDATALASIAAELLKESELALAQEFLPTEFDWRVGVLGRRPLFVCQYHMAHRHWQVIKHGANGKYQEGRFRTLPVADAPPALLRTALRAANLVGDGLYGVDLKQTPRGIHVIEINDNPNIDFGVEDAALGAGLYRAVMAEILRRLEARGRRRGGRAKANA